MWRWQFKSRRVRRQGVADGGTHGEARRYCPNTSLGTEDGSLVNLAATDKVGVDVCYSAKREVA